MILAFQEGFVLPGPSSPRSAFQYHFSVILIVILNGERISLQPVLPTSVVRCLHLSVPAKMFRGCGAPDGELLCGHWSMSTRRKSISIPDVPLWMKNEWNGKEKGSIRFPEANIFEEVSNRCSINKGKGRTRMWKIRTVLLLDESEQLILFKHRKWILLLQSAQLYK